MYRSILILGSTTIIIYVTVPSGQAPALPFQSRRILSALRTVNLPHYHILLPPGTIYQIYMARIPQPYSYPHYPYALQSMIFSPDPRQANDTQLCNHGLGSHGFTFQPTKPQWQDASSSSSSNFPWAGARTQAMLLPLLPKFETRGANPSLVELANPLLTAHADLGLSG